ncbi:MAG: oxidoreductase [Verrucomicrobia bacterium]|nr:oxidoreductase [Verrucomicrobiota bacterium]
MKQLVQDFKTGELKLVEVPPPAVAPGEVLVRNAFSLVSAGTERSTVEMGQASLLGKARQRPDLARQVFNTLKREGLAATLNKVQSRLDQWKALGYATAGTVIEVGAGVTEFAPGDSVACGGQDRASHAEIVAVPQHLCAKVPEGVSLEHAAFTTLGAIALHGVRQADVRLGETVAVIGLGLVGQLTVQLLCAAGCRVVGWDPQPEMCRLAGVAAGEPNSADAVIVAAATDSSEPLEQAAQLCRDRGRVVLVGRTGTEIPREIFYRKELDFRVSRSYGPGRYDPVYEDKGVDYPIGYVRWTEQRNMQAFLDLRLNLAPLITHVFPIDDALKAYDLITGKTQEHFVGVLLQYPTTSSPKLPHSSTPPFPRSSLVLGVIGAGNYAQGVLLPQFKANKDVTLATVCTATGAKAEKTRTKFGFTNATTDWRAVIADKAINTVLVATRHNLHAEIVCAALRAGKTVFCEKPLCLRAEELDEIIKAGSDRLMVGFNRRFAPFAAQVHAIVPPLVMRYRVSVQPLPQGNWYLDPEIGGGRILGEVCHFVDFLQFAARSKPARVYAQGFGANNVQASVRFANGSVGVVEYFEVADAALPKEQIEVFGGGQHLVVTDFRDKGQAEEVRQFVEAAKTGGPMPIPLEEIVASTRTTLAVLESQRTGQAVSLSGP